MYVPFFPPAKISSSGTSRKAIEQEKRTLPSGPQNPFTKVHVSHTERRTQIAYDTPTPISTGITQDAKIFQSKPRKENTEPEKEEGGLAGGIKFFQESTENVREETESNAEMTELEMPLQLPEQFKDVENTADVVMKINDIRTDLIELKESLTDLKDMDPKNFKSPAAQNIAAKKRTEAKEAFFKKIATTAANIGDDLTEVAKKGVEFVGELTKHSHVLEETATTVGEVAPGLADIKKFGTLATTAVDLQNSDVQTKELKDKKAALERLAKRTQGKQILPESFEKNTYITKEVIQKLQKYAVDSELLQVKTNFLSNGAGYIAGVAALLTPITAGLSAPVALQLGATSSLIKQTQKGLEKERIEGLKELATEVKESETEINRLAFRMNTIAADAIKTRADLEKETNPNQKEQLETKLLKLIDNHTSLQDQLQTEVANHNVLSKQLMKENPREVVTELLEALCFEKEGADYKPADIDKAVKQLTIHKEDYKLNRDYMVEQYTSDKPANKEKAIKAMSEILNLEYIKNSE